MVRYNPKAWIGLIFHPYSRHVLRTLLPVLGFMVGFAALVCYLVIDYFDLKPHEIVGGTSVHSLLGIVLGLFLVFRTNSAYERWWEGRKMWGSLVNSSRNFALKINAYLDVNEKAEREWFAMMVPNFVFAMKEHLRTDVSISDLDIPDKDFFEELKRAKHKPNKLASYLYNRVNQHYQNKMITGDQLINLDKELKDFVDILGACERIKNTPIPYSYSMFIKKFIFIYLITLPFGFVTTFEYITIPTVLLVTFVLLSVELIAEEIEDPFGRDINDLPTDDLSFKIKDNVREILL